MALTDNKAKIQALIAGINALPEEGSGTPSAPVLQEKTATPSTSAQVITPDSGYDGLSKVTLNAIPGEYIIPKGTKTVGQNGLYDVSTFANVNVAVGGGGAAQEYRSNIMLMATGTEPATGYIDCGFKPDAIMFHGIQYSVNGVWCPSQLALLFVDGVTEAITATYFSDGYNTGFMFFQGLQTQIGFEYLVGAQDWNWNYVSLSGVSIDVYAVKFT